MNEMTLVEEPVLEWLTDADRGIGWTFRDAAAMAAFDRPETDPLVERLLVEAIVRINDAVETEAQAKLAVEVLRRAMNQPDRLAANRETLALLRDGATIVLRPGEDAATVQFIAFDVGRQHLNDFTATNQYRVQGVRNVRDDTVLLVNGVPLVVAEYKSHLTSGKDWREAVRQLHRYQRQAPLMLAPNVFCVAADEHEFLYGTVLHGDADDAAVRRHMDSWGRWLSLYPETANFWTDAAADDADPLETSVRGLLRLSPCNVLDFLRHFVVFETRGGRTTKKVARYQQFEAANLIVDRAVALVGKEGVTPQDRTGLIWHTQGSGKSLTMIFAAQKLRRHPILANPTVLVVVDRRDLKTQLGDDFENCDYPNVSKAFGVEDLKRRLRDDRRETIITTIQAFQRMGDLAPVERDNVVSLIDEAHRSQKGKGKEGFAVTMRAKLPNGFRFGLTGTPIDRTMTNTHRDFGPRKDGEQERYLSYYGIKRAIKDGATLPVHYQRDKVALNLDQEALDVGFEEMADAMELEDEEAKDFVQRREARWKTLAKDERRVAIVAEKVLDHFLAYPDPDEFKAQLVCVDREACVLYKDALDGLLEAKGLPPAWSDVIYSEAQNDPPELARFNYTKAHADSLIEHFKLTPGEYERQQRERHGDDRDKWQTPLKILIVCDRLLTGFDAPVEQVMYLDKPLRDHTLLQAVARTNRPLPAMGKRVGVVVDYFGVFDDLHRALNFDESVVEEALIDWDVLRRQVPEELKTTLAYFDGITRDSSRGVLLASLARLRDPDAARGFESSFKSLETLWEAVSPDPILYDLGRDFAWLSGVYVAHRRRQNGPVVTHEELAAKTRELIRENTTFVAEAEALPVYKIDAEYLTKLDDLPTPTDKAAMLEAALTRELREGDGGFLYRQLGERLRRIKETRDTGDDAAEARLRELAGLADQLNAAKSEPERLNLNGRGEYGLFTVLRAHAQTADDAAVAKAARDMLAHLRRNHLLTAGWSMSATGRMQVTQSLLTESWKAEYAALSFPVEERPGWLDQAIDELAGADEA